MLFNFEGTVKAALSATCGDNSEEDPPVPIPNTVVKLLSADDTWGVTLWEIRTSPLFYFLYLRSTSGNQKRLLFLGTTLSCFFCAAKKCSLINTSIPSEFLTFVMLLDTENGKIVPAIWVATFVAPADENN